MRVSRWRSALEVVQALSIIAVCAVILWVLLLGGSQPTTAPTRTSTQRPVSPPLPVEPLSLEGAAILGNAGAKWALIVFSEFQCPYCGRFARETLPTLESDYIKPGRILLAFRHFPLPNHEFAVKAAEAVECAGQQGKFWEMHDRLFFDQRQLDLASLADRARVLGLDVRQFDTCLGGTTAIRVQADRESGRALMVTGTPTFFAGIVQPDRRVKVLRRLAGAAPVAQFKAALDSLLSSPAAEVK